MGFQPPPTPCRLRYMVKQLETGEVNVEELKRNLEYTASLLEAVYIDETRCGAGCGAGCGVGVKQSEERRKGGGEEEKKRREKGNWSQWQ